MPTALRIRLDISACIRPVTAGFKRSVTAAVIALLFVLSGSGARAQSFGDAFSAGVSANPLPLRSQTRSTEKHPGFKWGYEPEFDPQRLPIEKPEGTDPFLLPWHGSDWPSACVHDFFEDEARGTNWSPPISSPRITWGPILQGCTNGTIGPQNIPGGKRKGARKTRLIDRLRQFEAQRVHTKKELLKLVWSLENKPEPDVDQRKWLGRLYRRAAGDSPHAVAHHYYLILAALSEGDIGTAWKQAQSAYLQATGSHQRVVDIIAREFEEGNHPLEASLIRDFHQLSLFRKPRLRVHYEAAVRAIAVRNQTAAWKEIQMVHSLEPDNNELDEKIENKFLMYDQQLEADLFEDIKALELFKNNDLRSHFEAGIRAMQARNWQKAWQEMEAVYAQRQNDPRYADKIAHAFIRYDRSTEACIWMSRYLKVAPDWESFESAYQKRSEWECADYLKDLAAEKPDHSTWSNKDGPLKILIEPSVNQDRGLNAAFFQALNAWMITAEGRLDYIILQPDDAAAAKQAQIIVRKMPGTQLYSDYLKAGALRLPTIKPSPHKLATTYTWDTANQLKRAVITILDDGSYTSPTDLKEICLHELGHALGLCKHSDDDDDIMYAFKGPTKFEITARDKGKLLKLYRRQLPTVSGYEQFVRMASPCLEAGETEGMETSTIDISGGLVSGGVDQQIVSIEW